MSDKKRKVPKLRFPGFTDAWEQRKLGDEFQKVNERNDGSFGREHWISVAKMYFQEPEKVQSNNIDTRTYVMREGDIAFEGHPNSEFKFGRFVANDIGSGVVSELFPIYRHKCQYDNKYWKYAIQLERIMAPIFAKSITSSGNSSNKLEPSHFLRQSMSVATYEEQKVIGDFLNKFESLLSLHQRKLDNVKMLKKSLLQKLFPKDGEKIPELRFPGFTDDWEQRKLIDEVISIDTGKSKFTSKESGVYEILGSTSVIGYDDSYDYEGNFLLTARVGANAGTLYRHSGKVKISDNTVFIQGEQLDFLYYALLHFDIKRLSFGTGQPLVKASELKEQDIMMPVENLERMTIGTFFSNFVHLISLHQRKLDHLKELKKGLLQQMFV